MRGWSFFFGRYPSFLTKKMGGDFLFCRRLLPRAGSLVGNLCRVREGCQNSAACASLWCCVILGTAKIRAGERICMEAEFFFSSVEHKDFFLDQLAEAKRRKKRQDSYFKSLAYLCGLTAETRNHFSDIFDLSDWSIRPEAAEAGWQTGTSLRVTRLRWREWRHGGISPGQPVLLRTDGGIFRGPPHSLPRICRTPAKQNPLFGENPLTLAAAAHKIISAKSPLASAHTRPALGADLPTPVK